MRSDTTLESAVLTTPTLNSAVQSRPKKHFLNSMSFASSLPRSVPTCPIPELMGVDASRLGCLISKRTHSDVRQEIVSYRTPRLGKHVYCLQNPRPTLLHGISTTTQAFAVSGAASGQAQVVYSCYQNCPSSPKDFTSIIVGVVVGLGGGLMLLGGLLFFYLHHKRKAAKEKYLVSLGADAPATAAENSGPVAVLTEPAAAATTEDVARQV